MSLARFPTALPAMRDGVTSNFIDSAAFAAAVFPETTDCRRFQNHSFRQPSPRETAHSLSLWR